MARGVGGTISRREVIILNISVKGGRLFEEGDYNQGTAITAIIPARKYGNLQWTVARKNSNEL